MKKTLVAVVAACSLMLSGCGHPIDYNNKHYPTYGLLNSDSNKSKDVCYNVSMGNVAWSVILAETIVAPIYFIGFDIENPTPPNADGKCGIDSNG